MCQPLGATIESPQTTDRRKPRGVARNERGLAMQRLKVTFAVLAMMFTFAIPAPSADAQLIFFTWRSTASPMTVTPSAATGSTGTVWGSGVNACSSGTWTKWYAIQTGSSYSHTAQGTMCGAISNNHGHSNSKPRCTSLTGGTWYANCIVA